VINGCRRSWSHSLGGRCGGSTFTHDSFVFLGQEWSGKPAVLYDSILARALKKMTDAGLLVREETEWVSPAVYYSLTPQVVESLTALAPWVRWARAHPEIIQRAQAQSRRHRAKGVADQESLHD
jgi:DNA-binding PadR family transcriptional regulator